jgi:hypothetical protein
METIKELKAYECPYCHKLYKDEINAVEHLKDHLNNIIANHYWERGYNLRMIKYYTGWHWNLTEEQENITKDSCFVIEYWQCSKLPCYRIIGFNDEKINLNGKGGYSGYYGDYLPLESLPKAHKKEEFKEYETERTH